ncbi:MAG: hypothetical protein V2J25_02450 [Desulfatiglans sp.]|jgi:hypothetical protein|nr:hypothetical protein [Thermodesulfobacteriota bacterium]MEE4351705.1 hypothetical protein [Desulfatiglans sp.]
MEAGFIDLNHEDFDPQLYIQVLIAVAKADKDNGPREFRYIKTRAHRLGIDFDEVWSGTDKTFVFSGGKVSRLTAMHIIKDCIVLASMDKNFSLAEREKIYTYAAKLDIPRSNVDSIVEWLNDYSLLEEKWNKLVSGDLV